MVERSSLRNGMGGEACLAFWALMGRRVGISAAAVRRALIPCAEETVLGQTEDSAG